MFEIDAIKKEIENIVQKYHDFQLKEKQFLNSRILIITEHTRLKCISYLSYRVYKLQNKNLISNIWETVSSVKKDKHGTPISLKDVLEYLYLIDYQMLTDRDKTQNCVF